MNKSLLIKLLDQFKNNSISKKEILEKLGKLPFEDLKFAKIDHHRNLRTGHPEVIFCQGKTDDQIKKIYPIYLTVPDS